MASTGSVLDAVGGIPMTLYSPLFPLIRGFRSSLQGDLKAVAITKLEKRVEYLEQTSRSVMTEIVDIKKMIAELKGGK